MCFSFWSKTLRTHAKMQHNVILPTESKKGKKLGPRKNKTLRTSKPQVAPPIIRQTQAIVLPNITPLNLASSHNSQDGQSVASEDSWAHQVSFWNVLFWSEKTYSQILKCTSRWKLNISNFYCMFLNPNNFIPIWILFLLIN